METAYCVKCREKKNFEPTETKTYDTKKGKKFAIIGKCPDCGTKMFKFTRPIE